jgi:hypothetical protein
VRASPPVTPRSALVRALEGPDPVVAVELRPPRAGLAGAEGMDAWIDLGHALRQLTRAGRFVFLTDDALGQAEEENLAHLDANLGPGVDREQLVPFLTCKHSLPYCLLFADRAASMGFRSLTVVGGDRQDGVPRCVGHSYELRALLRKRAPELTLGGWANPHRDPHEQASYVGDPSFGAEFFLTQIVSHHTIQALETLLRAIGARAPGTPPPAVAGIFHYRSARPETLERLDRFFPVPAREITLEVEAGVTPEELTARSVRAALDAGARAVYLSNLGLRGAGRTLDRILALL